MQRKHFLLNSNIRKSMSITVKNLSEPLDKALSMYQIQVKGGGPKKSKSNLIKELLSTHPALKELM